MKKLFTIVLFAVLSLPVIAQNDIPNWSFENWDSTNYILPKLWDMKLGKISPVQPSHGGAWACKLENDSVYGNPGIILDGQSNDGVNFTGGKPYSQRPDSVKIYAKYHIASNDTARLVIIFKLGGTPIMIPQVEALAWGSNTDSFQELKFKVKWYELPFPIPPDSVIFGISCSDFQSHPDGPWPTENYLIIDDIIFTGTGITQQLPNNNFEQWDTTEIFTLQDWYNSDNAIAVLSGFLAPVERISDKTAGNYALLVQNDVSDIDSIRGYTFIPSHCTPIWDNKPAFALTQPFTHNAFSFDYKYLPQNNDSMSIVLSLFKNGALVGGAFYRDGATVSDWTTKDLSLAYSDQPDSAKIYLWAYNSDTDGKPFGNSKLYIDNLRFSTVTNIKPQADLNNSISVCPNPFTYETKISYQIKTDEKVVLKIMDVLGNEVAVLVNKAMPKGIYNVPFNASNLTKGIYFCRIEAGNYTETRKLVFVK